MGDLQDCPCWYPILAGRRTAESTKEQQEPIPEKKKSLLFLSTIIIIGIVQYGKLPVQWLTSCILYDLYLCSAQEQQ